MTIPHIFSRVVDDPLRIVAANIYGCVRSNRIDISASVSEKTESSFNTLANDRFDFRHVRPFLRVV
jgi:hypothetical protein